MDAHIAGAAGTTQGLFVCHLCKNEEESMYALEVHLRAEHLRWLPYGCGECPGVQMVTERFVREHIKKCHPTVKEPNITIHFDWKLEARLTREMSKAMAYGGNRFGVKGELAIVEPSEDANMSIASTEERAPLVKKLMQAIEKSSALPSDTSESEPSLSDDDDVMQPTVVQPEVQVVHEAELKRKKAVKEKTMLKTKQRTMVTRSRKEPKRQKVPTTTKGKTTKAELKETKKEPKSQKMPTTTKGKTTKAELKETKKEPKPQKMPTTTKGKTTKAELKDTKEPIPKERKPTKEENGANLKTKGKTTKPELKDPKKPSPLKKPCAKCGLLVATAIRPRRDHVYCCHFAYPIWLCQICGQKLCTREAVGGHIVDKHGKTSYVRNVCNFRRDVGKHQREVDAVVACCFT